MTEPTVEAHETTLVEVGGRTVAIDVPMAPLIRLLWENGIDTMSCCQGDGRTAYIVFPLESARAFYTWMDAAASEADEDTFGRFLWALLRGTPDPDSETRESWWTWKIEFVDRRRQGTSWGTKLISDDHNCDLVRLRCPLEHVSQIHEVLAAFPYPGLRWWENAEPDSEDR